MPVSGEGESPRSELVPQRNRQQKAEGNLPVAAFFGQLSETPSGVDPAYWPVQVLNELNAIILDKEDAAAGRLEALGVKQWEIGERFAPMKEHIQQVTTAYKIIAYPHCKFQGSRELIESQLMAEQERVEREQVELSDPELQILSKLTAARKLPFHPEKRVYKYDEVFHPSQPIEPALNGAQFIKWQRAQERAKEQGTKR
jgi:hypothetical protein